MHNNIASYEYQHAKKGLRKFSRSRIEVMIELRKFLSESEEQTIERLIEAGANVNAKNNYGITA